MSSRNMRLLPWAALRSDSEQYFSLYFFHLLRKFSTASLVAWEKFIPIPVHPWKLFLGQHKDKD
jgi:hypothetical protein